MCGPCIVHVYRHPKLGEAINAFVPLIAGAYAIPVFINLSVDMKRMKLFHNTLQEVVDNGKKGKPFCVISKLLFGNVLFSAKGPNEVKIYENVERNCRDFAQFLVRLGMGSGVIGVFIPTFGLSLVSLLAGNFDAGTWFFPVKYVVPFDSTTILGFYAKVVLYTVYALNSYYLVVLTAIGYFVSCCYYLNGFVENFQLMFDEVDQIVSQDKCMGPEVTIDINKRLKRAVEFHIKIFE